MSVDNIKILVIDDDDQTKKNLKNEIEGAITNCDVETIGFDNVLDHIENYRPDIIILDLFLGQPTNNDNQGNPVWAEIWRENFTPLIFYSAGNKSDVLPKFPCHHTFAKFVEKGPGDVAKLIKFIRVFQENLPNFNQIRGDFAILVNQAVREVYEYHAYFQDDFKIDNDTLFRSARRRLGAILDLHALETGGKLFAWEKYIIPPLGQKLLACDLIKKTKGSAGLQDYRLVLSPSCDLQQGKISKVLVARCFPTEKYLRKTIFGKDQEMKRIESTKKKDKLLAHIKAPHKEGCFLIPKFSNIIPYLCVSMKDLDVVDIKKISTGNKSDDDSEFDYIRIASIDSPFREKIISTVMHETGRVGTPDIDYKRFCGDFVDDHNASYSSRAE